MITIVIPAYNEGVAVVETIEEVKHALRGYEHEIIVVDDGSRDETAGIAENAGARVLRHPHNLGYGSALKTGIRAATFDTIVITDADSTYPNELIPQLKQEYDKGFNMVVGMRTGSYYRESFLKSCLRILLKWLVEFTTGREIPDINSGFRIFSKKEITPYLPRLCGTFSFTTSVTLAYMMTHQFVSYVPVPYRKRKGQSKVRLFKDMLGTLQYIVQAILYYNPLKMFLLMSSVVGFASLACVVVGLIAGLNIVVYFGVAGLLVGVLVFSLGLLAELLKQIMERES